MPPALSEKEVSKLYNRMAFAYDLWAKLTESTAHEEALSLAKLSGDQTVVETGVGTGRLFCRIVERNRFGLILGLDVSEGMLARARDQLKPLGGRVLLQRGSARELPYRTASVDVLFSTYLLDILPAESYEAILAEWRRVVRPHGRLVLANMTYGRHWYQRIWQGLYDIHPKIMGGCRSVDLSPYLPKAGWKQLERKEISQATFPSQVILAEKC